MATRNKNQGMSSRDKMIGAIAVLAVLAAVVVIYKIYSSSQVQVAKVINNPPGFSEKAQAMKGQTGVDDSPSDHIDVHGTSSK
jgi:hypothetical protein